MNLLCHSHVQHFFRSSTVATPELRQVLASNDLANNLRRVRVIVQYSDLQLITSILAEWQERANGRWPIGGLIRTVRFKDTWLSKGLY